MEYKFNRIAVVGLGYIGLPTAVAFARSLSDLSFNYLIFSKLIFSTILKKQSKSVCC